MLLVIKNAEPRGAVLQKLQEYFPGRILLHSFSTVSEAIEKLEVNPENFQLTIVEHEGQGTVLLKALIGLVHEGVLAIFTPLTDLQWTAPNPGPWVEVLDVADPAAGLYRLLKKSAALGRLPAPNFREHEEFVGIGIESLQGLTPLQSDVFSRIRKDHYVCVFKKGSVVEAQDLKKFIDSNRTEFYIKTSEIKESLVQVAKRIEDSSVGGGLTPDVAKKEFEATHSLLQDVVGQLGFTAEAQSVAKSCVSMALKALGSKPKLSVILKDLRSKEGAYIAAHSFMLGNVACALAHRIGWSSSATFFKLSLAAFLHDIPLKVEAHARIRDPELAHLAGLENEEIRLIRLHPVQAADYSRQFAEIPSDVDIILSQHHERPDGKGFPRGMPGKLISPLSALFIMSQDLVHAILEEPETTFEDYFRLNAAKYEVGQFRKILALLMSARAEPWD